MRLKGKATVITGAASGVGRATSLLFAREGAAVACVDIDPVMGAETAAMVRAEGFEAIFIETDLARPDAIARMAEACLAWRPAIHVLFNNAAIVRAGGLEEIRLEDWNHQIAVNLTAPWLCTHHLLPGLKAAGAASVIHHGSIDGALGNPNVVAYSVSKGGLIPLTHMMAHWLGRYAIRVNCINSGALQKSREAIPVRLTQAQREGRPMTDAMRKATPLGRPAFLEECASVALFLASDDSSYMSGSVLTLDGGRTGVTPGTF